MYQEIERNKRRSFLLILIFIALISLLGFIFGEFTGGGWAGLIIALIIALAMSFGSYYYSDTIVLKSMRARPAKKEEYPHLVNSVEGLSIAAGIPQPALYIIDDPSPNAFATGRNPEHGVVAVTTGLLNKMDRAEIEGVLAHEIAHIRNYDTRISTLAAVMVGATILLSTWLRRTFLYSGGRRKSNKENRGGEVIFVLIALILSISAPLFAKLIQLAVSRQREFLADSDAALITRYPEGLAKALEKLARTPQELATASQATAHLFIVNPFSLKRASQLMSTHPPIEERIKRLRQM